MPLPKNNGGSISDDLKVFKGKFKIFYFLLATSFIALGFLALIFKKESAGDLLIIISFLIAIILILYVFNNFNTKLIINRKNKTLKYKNLYKEIIFKGSQIRDYKFDLNQGGLFLLASTFTATFYEISFNLNNEEYRIDERQFKYIHKIDDALREIIK